MANKVVIRTYCNVGCDCPKCYEKIWEEDLRIVHHNYKSTVSLIHSLLEKSKNYWKNYYSIAGNLEQVVKKMIAEERRKAYKVGIDNATASPMGVTMLMGKGAKAERERIRNEVNEMTWLQNNEGVKELKDRVDYIKVSDILSLLKN